jgi:hypothetical protein
MVDNGYCDEDLFFLWQHPSDRFLENFCVLLQLLAML